MKKVFLSLLIVATMSVNVAYSQEQKQDVPPKKGEVVATDPKMKTVILAGQLAKYGYENNSASALIEAAELYLSAGLTEFKPDSVVIGKGVETKKDETISFNPQKILADAKTLADGDQVLLAMIDKVEKSKPSRGAVGGPKYGEYIVYGNRYNLFSVKFWANERATIVVTGDGSTDLDLYVYDENSNLIARDEDYSDDCVVNFIPRWTGQYVVKIVNRGGISNTYAIGTN